MVSSITTPLITVLQRQDRTLVWHHPCYFDIHGHELTHLTASSRNPYPDLKSQKAFEKALLEKTAKQTGDILLFDGRM